MYFFRPNEFQVSFYVTPADVFNLFEINWITQTLFNYSKDVNIVPLSPKP